MGTVLFAFDSQDYEIELSKANTKAFEKVMTGYVEHARRVRETRGRRSGGASARRDLAAVRSWAHDNGYQVSERGRVAAAVLEAFDAAH